MTPKTVSTYLIMQGKPDMAECVLQMERLVRDYATQLDKALEDMQVQTVFMEDTLRILQDDNASDAPYPGYEPKRPALKLVPLTTDDDK